GFVPELYAATVLTTRFSVGSADAVTAPGAPAPPPPGPMPPPPPVDERGDQREQYHRGEREPPSRVHAPTVPARATTARPSRPGVRRIQPNR
ncbi:hypothetical protein ACWEGV_16175, partial [Streptomyces sp. NPDC004976]